MSRWSHRLAHAAVGLACVLAFAGTCRAQDVPEGRQPEAFTLGQGTHIFRRLLHNAGCKPLSGFNNLRRSPDSKVLIILGDVEVLDNPGFDLHWFVQSGGSVLIATDRGYHGFKLQFAQVELAPGNVEINESRAYRRMRDCVIVKPISNPPGLFDGLNRIATNRSGFLLTPGERPLLKPLAALPDGAYLPEQRGNRAQPVGRELFAMGDERGARLLVMADHSVFINAMLWQPDNDNLDFTYRCVDWLTDHGKRKEVLFIDDSKIQDSFDIPLREIPPIPLDSIPIQIQEINNFLRGIEEEDRFNYWLLNLFDSIPRHKVFQFLIAVGSIGLAMYGINRLSQARHRLEPGVPLLAAAVARSVPRGNLLDQRRQAMALEGNYWEAARGIAREGLASIFRSDLSPQTGAEIPSAMPRLEIDAGWWQRRKLKRQVAKLWALAFDDMPVRVSAKELQALPGKINQLLQAKTLHGIRFATTEPSDQTSTSSKNA